MAKVQEFGTNADAFRLIGERLKNHATRPNIYGYKPHEKQIKFHSSSKKVRLYIGGNRSGKTVGGIVEDLWYATGRHPYKDLAARWDGPTRGRIVSVDFINGHEKIIMPELARWLAPSDLRGGSWSTAFDKQERVLNFTNGSTIELMSYDQDLDKFAGTSRHWTHFDEEPPQNIYTECAARTVDTGGDMWITMTPVEGMTWIFDKIYEPGLPGDNDLYDVIEVSMTENPYLNEGEIQIFLDSLDEDERKAREHGKFVQLGGLIYKDFGDTHIVPRRDVPKDWMWVASLDHGFNNPTAWLWHAVSPDGQVITFHEHYLSGWTIDQHAAEVHKINNELGRPPDYYIGDPSIRNTDPITATSIYEEYIKYGIPIVLANNDVSAGIIRVARYLRTKDANGTPKLVITENCHNLIREMKRYRWATYANKTIQSKNNPHEKPNKKDDHACDSLRYFIMSRPDLAADTPGTGEEHMNLIGAVSAAPAVAIATFRETERTEWRTVEGDMQGWETDDMGVEW
jgi:phage terminase large subunit-like protein